MAPLADLVDLVKRQSYPYCRNGQYPYNGTCREYSAWYWWGRWVLAGIVVFAFFVFLAIICCINSRRRRRRGVQPMYGTGWMSNQAKYNQAYPQQGYQPGHGQNNAYGGYQPPPPAYNAPPAGVQNNYTGSTFNPNDGYYAGHNEGIQLQQPQNAYQRDVYAPPTGPPPGK